MPFATDSTYTSTDGTATVSLIVVIAYKCQPGKSCHCTYNSNQEDTEVCQELGVRWAMVIGSLDSTSHEERTQLSILSLVQAE